MIGIVDMVGWAYFGKDLVSFRKTAMGLAGFGERGRGRHCQAFIGKTGPPGLFEED